MSLRDDIAPLLQGDVADDQETLAKYSRDTSIFTRTPRLVVFPKSERDVCAVVKYVHEARAQGVDISITGRSAGTDMTGGPLTDSIVLVFTKYMNKIGPVAPGYGVSEPGAYYRDFEKETLRATGKIFPPYPASRELCAIGGIVSNNSGGELTLRYGKANKYVQELSVVLSDGSTAVTHPISFSELSQRAQQPTLEGSIYKNISALIREHAAEIKAARPDVSKNSAGYALWNVIDEQHGTFDLTQLIVGSQGTLALVSKAKLGLVKTSTHRAMLVVFMSDLEILPEVVSRILEQKPESFESYDDKTFSLAVRYLPQMLRQMGIFAAMKLGFAFVPDVLTVLRGGLPKLVLMAEFAENTAEEAVERTRQARASLSDLHVRTLIARSEAQSAKYWKVRRESFALLRKNIHGRYAAPFIDDIVVHPRDYPKFLPELEKLVSGHSFIYTIAGHIGDGNFHIIPLVEIAKPEARQEMLDLMPKVYDLVAKYKGSITGEHNDGIIRTPYLPTMFSPKMIELFAEVKRIFDPKGVFNPGKKTGGTVTDIERSMITHL